MTYDKAMKIARACIEAEIKRLAVNANMHDMMKLDAPACVAASGRRKELRAALDALGQKVLL